MSPRAGMEIRGLKEAQKDMERIVKDLHGRPMLDAMRDATMAVQRDAKRLAPVDTGALRSSITPEVKSENDTLVGVVGSNLIYAPFVELGTRPHWPPIASLTTWARRHGTSAYVVARAIATRGTKAVKYLERAFQQNAQYIHRKLEQAADKIMGV